jgi:hypothetical protein
MCGYARYDCVLVYLRSFTLHAILSFSPDSKQLRGKSRSLFSGTPFAGVKGLCAESNELADV